MTNDEQAFVGSVTGTMPQVSAGRLRAIATGHRERLRSMPDLPTVAESLPGFTNDGWYGIVGPAGMPAPIIDKLYAEMKRALAAGVERMDPQRACTLDESSPRCGY